VQEALAQLDAALAELSAQRRTLNLFFRDDDVDENEDSLHALVELFLRHKVPINLEIIPARLTDAAIAWLRRCHEQHPDLIELNQHGWQHSNHEPTGRKCEFGPSRGYDEQLADIKRGKTVLAEAFGAAFSPIFTPPWNRCTTETYRVLDELGFHALSALRSTEPVVGYSFRELSVTLDLYTWRGGATLKLPAVFVSELIDQLRAGDTIGIMLHHKVMNEPAWAWLNELLAMLRRYEFIKFHTFQSLLKAT
jgi:peptidoglycan/xylan/chitin deacetylase (PgdA/CDA1 family)